MKTLIEIDFETYPLVYCESIANKVTRALLEAFPNKYNHVYASDLDQIISYLQQIRQDLESGKILSSEKCKTLGN